VIVRGMRRMLDMGLALDVVPERFDVVHLPVLRELVDEPASDADSQRAAWLLDVHRATHPLGTHRVGTRPRRQLPLFL